MVDSGTGILTNWNMTEEPVQQMWTDKLISEIYTKNNLRLELGNYMISSKLTWD
jgi:hypothetical protein